MSLLDVSLLKSSLDIWLADDVDEDDLEEAIACVIRIYDKILKLSKNTDVEQFTQLCEKCLHVSMFLLAEAKEVPGVQELERKAGEMLRCLPILQKAINESNNS